MDEKVDRYEVLRLIYQGRFLHGNVTLGALRLQQGKSIFLMLLVFFISFFCLISKEKQQSCILFNVNIFLNRTIMMQNANIKMNIIKTNQRKYLVHLQMQIQLRLVAVMLVQYVKYSRNEISQMKDLDVRGEQFFENNRP